MPATQLRRPPSPPRKGFNHGLLAFRSLRLCDSVAHLVSVAKRIVDMPEAVIVSAVRTAVGKAPKGSLRHTRPDDMAAAVIKGAFERVPQVEPSMISDVILGCAMPEAEQGNNVARTASLLTEIPHSAAAMTINRFCSSGLQAIALASDAVLAGRADVVIAGGTESMSLIPMGGHKFAPNPTLLEQYPDSYLGMGMTAELVAKKFGIDREQSDAFALASHQKALAAIEAGRFKDEVIPLAIPNETPSPPQGVWTGEMGDTRSDTWVTHSRLLLGPSDVDLGDSLVAEVDIPDSIFGGGTKRHRLTSERLPNPEDPILEVDLPACLDAAYGVARTVLDRWERLGE